MKYVSFVGDSLEALRKFPQSARRDAGYQIDRIQRGFDPDHWRPMTSIGSGVREIRIVDQGGAFRVIYTTIIGDAVYVLHAFQKKTHSTAKRDLDLAAVRYARLRSDRR